MREKNVMKNRSFDLPEVRIISGTKLLGNEPLREEIR